MKRNQLGLLRGVVNRMANRMIFWVRGVLSQAYSRNGGRRQAFEWNPAGHSLLKLLDAFASLFYYREQFSAIGLRRAIER